MWKCLIIFLLVFGTCPGIVAQTDPNLVIGFDFNEHEIKENQNLVSIKPVHISLVNDRFGNERSAIYCHGNPGSYLNLGNSELLKPRVGSISIWVNMDRPVYAGKGSEADPIICTRNGPGEDFNQAFGMCYDFKARRLCVVSHKDSTLDINIKSEKDITFNSWYHLVFTFSQSEFSFYVNGQLQQSAPKLFDLTYLEGDTVLVGNTGSKKNYRWSQGMFDDIRIYHHALTAEEVTALYNEPNPNKTKLLMMEIARYAAIVLVFVLIIVIILIRNRRKLRKQREQFELNSRISDLEIKVIKNQMNPHFISNCLAAIQNLIYMEDYKKAAQYITKFSFLMRQVLNFSDKTYITLTEELSIVNLNIELEQLRFKNEFEFVLDIQQVNTDDVLIPSLITQPFIENAIWHGLLPLGDKRQACLRMTVYEKGDTVFLEIEDNGVGRDPDKAAGSSKGTKLVMDKIDSINRLMKDNGYKLEIVDLFDEHQQAAGTRVVIQLKDSKQ